MASKQVSRQTRFRQIHRTLAPVMVLPLMLTLATGVLYQIAEMNGQGRRFHWLLNLHKGNFIVLNLEGLYVFLNALGLLFLTVTGIVMWNQLRRRPIRHEPKVEVGSEHR